MTTPTGADPHDDDSIASRTGLLDALDALGAHRTAVILVGAQAVYLRTGDAGMTIAPTTRDADLVLDLPRLADKPAISTAMTGAGFTLKPQPAGGTNPGRWTKQVFIGTRELEAPVDLIVPSEAQPDRGKSHRSAQLPAHGRLVAMLTHGLEGALVDHDGLAVSGVGGDTRISTIAVAGPAALLIAKLIKLSERLDETRGRAQDKDASDVLRLIRTTPPTVMAERLQWIRHQAVAAPVAEQAITALHPLFGTPAAPGVVMARRAVTGDLDPARVADQLTAYTADVIRRLEL